MDQLIKITLLLIFSTSDDLPSNSKQVYIGENKELKKENKNVLQAKW